MIFICSLPLPVYGVSISLAARLIVMGSDYDRASDRVNEVLRRKSGNSSRIPPNREYYSSIRSLSEADTISASEVWICVRMRSVAGSKELLMSWTLHASSMLLPLNSKCPLRDLHFLVQYIIGVGNLKAGLAYSWVMKLKCRCRIHTQTGWCIWWVQLTFSCSLTIITYYHPH